MTTTRPTLDVVARQARVSRQTVSNVLNAPHRVRTDTRQRVQDTIDALGYRPDRAARQLRTRRSQLIGVRIEPIRDGVNGNVLDRFLHEFTAATQTRGNRVLLFTAHDDASEVIAYDDLVDGVGLDALVVTGTHVGDSRTAWLHRRAIPFVTFGRPWDGPEPGRAVSTGPGVGNRHDWVDVDGCAGTHAAVMYLHGLGHRRIAWIGWPRGAGAGDDRRSGWLSGMAAVPGSQGWGGSRGTEAAGPDTGATGRHSAARQLDGPPDTRPSAIVCASDSLALGVLAELTARGLDPRAPDGGVSVIGFDDTTAAAAVGLASVAQPIAAAAAACARMLAARVADPALPHEEVLLAPRLTPRASARPPRTRPY